MALIEIVVILIVIGILLGLFNSFVPPTFMDSKIKTIINIVVVVIVVFWLLHVFGLLPLRGGPSTEDLKVR